MEVYSWGKGIPADRLWDTQEKGVGGEIQGSKLQHSHLLPSTISRREILNPLCVLD